DSCLIRNLLRARIPVYACRGSATHTRRYRRALTNGCTGSSHAGRGHISESDDMIASVSAVVASSPFRLPAAPLPTDLVAKYFRGLGDPIRLRILQLLRSEGELSVGEIARRLGVPQPQVSNHLACLRWCGFIDARRDGRTVYNRITDQRVETMLELAASLLAENAEHIAACCRIEDVKR